MTASSILYDNTRIAVARILGDGKRPDTCIQRYGRGPWPPRQGGGQGRSSAIAAGTSWCRCRSGTSMISTRILKPAAPSDGRNNCVATTRRSANAWNGIVRFFSAFPQSPTTPATSARGGSVRCRCAMITPSPHGSAGWSAAMCGHQLRRRGDCQAPAFIRARGLVRCTICPCWSKSNAWMVCCRRCSAISAAYLKRGWAKPGSGLVQVLRLIESFSLDDVRAAISEALR